jgi:hypothetical protein
MYIVVATDIEGKHEYGVYPTPEKAESMYESLKSNDNVELVSYAKIIDSSEPDWV